MTKLICAIFSKVPLINNQKPAALLLRRFSSCISSWRVIFLAMPLLLAWLPAQATEYNFPLNPPPGCVGTVTLRLGVSTGNYTCAALTINAGDVITIERVTRFIANVTINGNFTTPASGQINAGGSASNLNFVVNGTTDIGGNSNFKANLSSAGSSGSITVGAGSVIVGNLYADNALIYLGDDTNVTGNVLTGTGIITTGDRSTVTGNVATQSGAITIGADSTVNGNVNDPNTSKDGAVTIGARSRINGSIVTGAGAITVGASAQVSGLIKTVTGAITVGADAQVTGSVVTVTGAITVGAGATVGGVASNDGAVTIGADSTVNGSVCSGNSGAITIGARAIVAGNVITATAGAITVGADARVAGAAKAKGSGSVSIAAGAQVGTTENNFTCADAIVPPPPPPPPPPSRIKSREWRQLFMR